MLHRLKPDPAFQPSDKGPGPTPLEPPKPHTWAVSVSLIGALLMKIHTICLKNRGIYMYILSIPSLVAYLFGMDTSSKAERCMQMRLGVFSAKIGNSVAPETVYLAFALVQPT